MSRTVDSLRPRPRFCVKQIDKEAPANPLLTLQPSCETKFHNSQSAAPLQQHVQLLLMPNRTPAKPQSMPSGTGTATSSCPLSIFVVVITIVLLLPPSPLSSEKDLFARAGTQARRHVCVQKMRWHDHGNLIIILSFWSCLFLTQGLTKPRDRHKPPHT